MTRPELVELGDSRPMSHFNRKKAYLNKLLFLKKIVSIGLCGNMNGFMLDYARSVGLS